MRMGPVSPRLQPLVFDPVAAAADTALRSTAAKKLLHVWMSCTLSRLIRAFSLCRVLSLIINKIIKVGSKTKMQISQRECA